MLGPEFEEQAEIKINVQTAAPTMSCSTLESFYFPGDGKIFVTLGSNFSTAIGAEGAPIDRIMVFGSLGNTVAGVCTGGAFSTCTNYETAFDIVGRLDTLSAASEVNGFVNTTTGADNTYNLYFSPRDKAGIFQNSNACNLAGVQTSKVQGFLAENACFLATATFQVQDNPQLSLLRNFRDRFLENFSLGRRFVQFYYSWSPAAAQWLIDHPTFRYPVLLLLTPLQVVAWLVLHPLYMLLGFFAGLGMLLGGFSLRRRLA